MTDPRRVARRRLETLAKQAPLAVSGRVEGVHQARVASRRLREFLPLLASTPEARREAASCRRRVRRLTRGFGPVRELDVALINLADVCEGRAELDAAAAVMGEALTADRAVAVLRMLHAVQSVDLAKLSGRVLALAESHVDLAARRSIGLALAARLGDRGHCVRAAIENAGAVYAPDRLHQIRIAMKKFRYALELAQEFGRFRLAGSIRRLKALQELLGELHDFEMLARRVRDCGADAPDGDPQASLTTLARYLDGEIRRRHSEFLGARDTLRPVFRWSRHVRLRLDAPAARREHGDDPENGRAPANPAEAAG